MRYLNYLSRAPTVEAVSSIHMPEVIQMTSYQDIPIYQVRKANCGIVMIDLVFQAGRPQEKLKLAAASCAALMRESAGSFSAAQLSERIDFLGASITCTASLDHISIKAISQKRHLSEITAILKMIINEPQLKNEDWQHIKSKSKEKLKIQLAKNDVVSYRLLTEKIYGSNHPYGYNSTSELYDHLELEEIKAHFHQYVKANHCQLFVAGDLDDKDQSVLDGLCQSMTKSSITSEKVDYQSPAVQGGSIVVPGALNQTSIRIGRRSCTMKHPDYFRLQYVCNLLGGYFGSRLVVKIREEMGLTYSIYCLLDNHVYDGDIMIAAEVSNENVWNCMKEIHKAMETIREELVSEEECATVNKYMMGNYMNLFDGPFNSIRTIKSLALADIPLDDLDTLIKASLSFDSYQIRDMARKYFDRNDFWNVIVGAPE